MMIPSQSMSVSARQSDSALSSISASLFFVDASGRLAKSPRISDDDDDEDDNDDDDDDFDCIDIVDESIFFSISSAAFSNAFSRFSSSAPSGSLDSNSPASAVNCMIKINAIDVDTSDTAMSRR